MNYVISGSDEKVFITSGNRTSVSMRYVRGVKVWIHDLVLEKNHLPKLIKFDVGDKISRIEIESLVDNFEITEIQDINNITKEKIISEIVKMHSSRYGVKLSKNKDNYVPKRNTYIVKDLVEDLKFTLNHLQYK